MSLIRTNSTTAYLQIKAVVFGSSLSKRLCKPNLIHTYDDEYNQNAKAEGKPRAREERKEAEVTESKGSMRGGLKDTSLLSINYLQFFIPHLIYLIMPLQLIKHL